MGRTSTHVANRYHRNIFARCDTEKHLDSVDLFDSGSLDGFVKIVPNDFVRFQVDCRRSSTVYISIYAVDEKGYDLICNNLPKNEDRSVMVTEAGQVVDTVPGKIWNRVY